MTGKGLLQACDESGHSWPLPEDRSGHLITLGHDFPFLCRRRKASQETEKISNPCLIGKFSGNWRICALRFVTSCQHFFFFLTFLGKAFVDDSLWYVAKTPRTLWPPGFGQHGPKKTKHFLWGLTGTLLSLTPITAV